MGRVMTEGDDLDSDSAGEQDNLSPLKQNNLNHLLMNQSKMLGGRPKTSQVIRR